MLGAKIMGFLGTHFSAVFVRNGSETAQERPRMPKRQKMGAKLHVGNKLSIFTLRMPIFDHDVGGEKYGFSYVVFVLVWAT